MRSGRTGFAGLRCARQRVQRQGQLGADRHRRRGQGHRPHDRRRGAIPARDGAAVAREKNMTTDRHTTQPKGRERQEAALLSDILPLPEPKFTGQIGSSYTDSKPDVISLPMAPEGAPNVLLVLLDDVGFGQTSTFGGPVNTPTLQRLANEGLRYNRFHTTPSARRHGRRCSRDATPIRST